jgi:hypothetical protein
MAERCCRAKRCGLVSLVVVVHRALSRRRARAVEIAEIVVAAKSAADVGGIAGVDAMRTGDAAASVRMRRVPTRRRRSIARSLAGSILPRLCCRP